jgi:hypothetical protein
MANQGKVRAVHHAHILTAAHRSNTLHVDRDAKGRIHEPGSKRPSADLVEQEEAQKAATKNRRGSVNTVLPPPRNAPPGEASPAPAQGNSSPFSLFKRLHGPGSKRPTVEFKEEGPATRQRRGSVGTVLPSRGVAQQEDGPRPRGARVRANTTNLLGGASTAPVAVQSSSRAKNPRARVVTLA